MPTYTASGQFPTTSPYSPAYRLDISAVTAQVAGGTSIVISASVTKFRTHGTLRTFGTGSRSWSMGGGRTDSTSGASDTSGNSSWPYSFPAASTNTVSVYGGFTRYVAYSHGSSTTLSVTVSGSGSSFLTSTTVSVTVPLFSEPVPPAPTTPVWQTTSPLATATVGVEYSATVTADPVTSYSLTGFSGQTGGLSYSENTISGTPTTAGTASFTFRANNGTSFADRTFSIPINAPPAEWTTTSFTEDVRVGTPYTKTITATGIRATSPYALVGGSTVLPSGLSLNTSTGVIAGTPSTGASQTFNFTVNAFNSAGTATASETFTLNRRQPLPVWSDDILGRPRVDVAYSDQVTATNAASTNAYSAVGLSGTGLALNANTGAITGTVTSTSTFSFTITAKNADNQTIEKNYTFTPLARLAVWSDQIITTPTVRVNQPYTDGVAATNAVSYALETPGTLPPGILLNTGSGAITGTPTTQGTYNFKVLASNASTPTAETIISGLLTILVEPSAGGAIWNGTTWVPSVFKVWNGAIWEEAPVKIWNGSTWADPIN
jgi:hypothetical protein